MISVFLFLTLLCIIGSGFIHLIRTQMHSYLWLSNSPLHMYHSFFIHPSFDGHLGCFHVLAIVNSTAMNTGMYVSFSILVSSGYMPRSGIVRSYGGLILVFKGISILSSILAVSIYIPTNSARAFPFLHTLSSIYCL